MKNLSLALNVVLFIAVAILYFLHFSGNSNSGSSQSNSNFTDSLNSATANLRVGYVDMDILLDNYKFYNDLEKTLIAKRSQMEGQYQGEATRFQTEYADFMDKAQRGGFLSEESMKYAENQLVEKQQRLQQLEVDLSTEIAAENQKMNERLYDSINKYLESFNKDLNFDYIISNSMGGVLLYSNKALNLTDTILSGLNTRYDRFLLME